MGSFQVVMNNDLTAGQAIQEQNALRAQIRIIPYDGPLEFLAGVDVSYNRFSNHFFASAILLKLPELTVVEQVWDEAWIDFPYIPGLLSFREIPVLLKALAKLKQTPDVIMVDGHGIAHPRRMGIATHLGLMVQTPTIGCAKKLLKGTYLALDQAAGASTPLWIDDEQVGTVFRSKTGCQPLFVSPGHLMDTKSALKIVKQCLGKYRMPDPTRLAHNFVNEVRVRETRPLS